MRGGPVHHLELQLVSMFIIVSEMINPLMVFNREGRGIEIW